MTQNMGDLLKLIYFTVLYHLGNKWQCFASNTHRKIHCLCNGRKVAVELRQTSGDIFTLYEVLGTVPYRFPYQALGQVNTIIDLGAHIGLATLYFATLFPRARLFSIEPVPQNFQLLERNCNINGIHSTLLMKCIGSRKRIVSIYLNLSSNRHSLFKNMSPVNNDPYIEVEMITMDDLIIENDIDKIDILKVDIEGSEAELFAECKSWISKVRLIIIEIHPTLVSHETVIHAITSNGFEYMKPGTFAADYEVFLRRDIVNGMNR